MSRAAHRGGFQESLSKWEEEEEEEEEAEEEESLSLQDELVGVCLTGLCRAHLAQPGWVAALFFSRYGRVYCMSSPHLLVDRGGYIL
jgi:hypothetical protein